METITKDQNKVFIFLSGLGESEDVWKPIVAHLKLKNYKLLAVPGFGKVDKLEVLHQENFNEFLEKYLSEFDDKEIYLVGHSLGSVLFLGASETLKKKNVKLILLQFPYTSQFLSRSSFLILKRFSNMSLSQIGAIQKKLGTNSRILQKIYNFVGRFIDSDIPKIDKILGYPMFIQTYKNANSNAIKESAQLLINFDYREILENTTIPILIIQGTKDKRIKVKATRSHKINNQNVNVIWLENFAHSGFITEPERIVKIIKEFNNQNY